MTTTEYKGVLVSGSVIQAFLESFSGVFRKEATSFLKEAGINEALPEKWFSLDSYLKVLYRVERDMGKNITRQVGRKILSNAVFPPNVVDLESSLTVLNIAYHLNHSLDGVKPMFDMEKGVMESGIGDYLFHKRSDKDWVMECQNPYPSSFDFGLLESFINRFEPSAKISMDPSSNRESGGDKDVFLIVRQ